MEPTPRIAVAQTTPVRGCIETNLRQHLALAEAARREGAELVVFPELSLTGYELDLAVELSLTEDDPRLEPLRDFSRSHGITLIVGGPLLGHERPYIAAWVLRPAGDGPLYRKRHLGAVPAAANPKGPVPPSEPTVFAPGRDPAQFPWGPGLAWVAICADTGHRSHSSEAASAGATLYSASVFVVPNGYDDERQKLIEIARDHRMLVACSNFGGPSGGLASAGRSCVLSTRGEVLAEAPRTGVALAIAESTDGGWAGRTVVP